jgi:hypothetical protein
VRAALRDAASVAILLVAKEAMVVEKLEKKGFAMGVPGMGNMDFCSERRRGTSSTSARCFLRPML